MELRKTDPLAGARGHPALAKPVEPGSHERQRVDKRHLPRLAPEYYRGRAGVHWTLTIASRETGWLDMAFHHEWRHLLLHACARYSLASPTYTLMPDHMHLLWLGLQENGSDQRIAMEFLRKQLRPHLAPAVWQPQSYDHVLREHERERGAFQAAAQYVLENPVRAGLASRWQTYPYVGCCIPGYPDLTPRTPDYWDRFWRCYNYLVDRRCS